MDLSDKKHPKPASWPDADFIIGNPPFLGGSLIWEALGTEYRDTLWECYDIPGFSDLCCYWFELARRAIEKNEHIRSGLLATQGIRGSENPQIASEVEKAIRQNAGLVAGAMLDRRSDEPAAAEE